MTDNFTQPQSNGFAIASFVCGLVGVVAVGVVLGPIAVILGVLGLKRANQGAPNKGLAIAGIVLGVLALVLTIIFIVAFTYRGFLF